MKKMWIKIASFCMGAFMMFGVTNIAGFAEGEMTNVEETVKTIIYDGLMNMKTSIDVAQYNLSDYDITEIYQQVIMTSPELFHVSFRDMETTGRSEENADSEELEYIVEQIQPAYILEAIEPEVMQAEYEAMQAEMEAVAEDAFAGIADTMSDFEKALYLHDYVLENSDYDWYRSSYAEIPDISYTAYGCLVNEITATHGYALAYKYLMDKADVECKVITGLSTAWNAVKLNGEYYFVDLHWDNPVRYYRGSNFDHVGHKFFLITAEELQEHETGEHDWWAQDIVPTDTTYSDAPFRYVTSPYNFYNGEWYYWGNVDNDVKQPVIAKTKDPMEMGTSIFSLADYKWYTYADPEKAWKEYQGNVDVDTEKGILYFNSPNQIFRLNLNNSTADPELMMTLDTSYWSIYGVRLDKNVLIWGMAETPFQWETLSYLNLDEFEKEMKMGDVSGDGAVDAGDALIILKKTASMQVDCIDLAADCNEDGVVDANDALWVLKSVAKFW